MVGTDLRRIFDDVGKKNLSVGLIAVLLIGILVTWAFIANNNSYAVMLEGEKIAVVEEEEVYNSILQEIIAEKSKAVNQDVKVIVKPEVEEIRGKDGLIDETALRELLLDKLEFTTAGTAIVINGEERLIVQSREIAEELIAAVKDNYLPDNDRMELEKVKVVEEVQLKEVEIGLGEYTDKELAFNLLANGIEKVETYTVESGDSLWTIARANNLSVSDLQEANPQLESDLLSLGQELNLVKLEPMVNVMAVFEETRKESVAFTTTYRNDSSMYRGQSNVVQAGARGEREVTYRVVQENGRTVEREELASNVTKEPQTRIVSRGTKTIVASRGSGDIGRLGWPVSGTITSPFGPRGGGYHYGLDIAARSGASVRAADAGRVTFSGWQGAYGYMIEIDHGDGVSTRYAHNSSNLVSVGDRVSAGQVIARVGSTGRSTGPHVHFEVRINGQARNPINYLP